jgi:hypothetical protein
LLTTSNSTRRGGAFAALCVLGCLASFADASASGTSTLRLTATLDAKHQVPAQVVKTPLASGHFTATLARSTNGTGVLTWGLTFRNLSSPATFAYVFLPSTSTQGQTVLDLCRPRCTTGARGTIRLVASITRALTDRTRAAYVEILTRSNPKGEIRGRIARIG